MSKNRIVSGLFLAAILAGAPLAASADPAPSTQSQVVAHERATPAADAESYAAQEQRSPEAAKFAGGNSTIYIGGGVVTVLLIVILVILLV